MNTKTSKPFAKLPRDVLAHVDRLRPVQVYRNLHKNCLSVRQGGIVKCHAENVVLKDCKFIINEKGRNRVRKEKRKNVHAWIKGTVVDASETWGMLPFEWEEAYYNPYTCDHWVSKFDAREIDEAQYVDLWCGSGQCDVIMINYTFL